MIALLVAVLLAASSAWPQSAAAPLEQASERPEKLDEQAFPEPVGFVPLPVYATIPNEGPTYGFMPVFLDVDRRTGRIWSISAPSITWNAVTHLTFTGRYFQYPNDFEERLFQATYATRLYREVVADWFTTYTKRGQKTWHYSFQYRRDPFRRFFGIGYNSSLNDETTYTLDSIRAFAKRGYNLADGFNLSGTVGINAFNPMDTGVLGIKPAFERFGNVTGMGGSAMTYMLVGLRYDTRPIREYSEEGFSVEAIRGGAVSTVSNRAVYGIERYQAKALWKQFKRVNGAAQAYIGKVYGGNIPFYERQSLGGSFLLRGYILDRFVDNGAWTIDLEQRITAAILNIQGSQVHVRIDPFITAGQVYNGLHDAFKRVRYAWGTGIRAFVPPNVIGRIDIGRNPDETNIFVELGYPF